MPDLPPATVMVILGLLSALGSVPLVLGLVGPNCFYGIRVAAAFASERNWYAINRFGGTRFLGFGAVVALAGLVLGRYPAAPFWVPILGLLATLVLLLWTVRAIDRYARSL